MKINWIPDTDKDVLSLPPKIVQDFNIKAEKIKLHLGAWSQTMKVRIQEGLDENSIGLPDDLNRSFTIPNVPYDMYIKNGNLFLGPVIGIVLYRGDLIPELLDFWAGYCRNYDDIRGLVYFCTVDGIDMNTKIIRGYYYDPSSEGKDHLKSGSFPYPGVVYQRAEIPRKTLENLAHSGAKVFNSYLFNKFEMWDALSKVGFPYTPHTSRLTGPGSLEKMLNLYDSVYLKPGRGRLGVGILKVAKEPSGFLLKDGFEIEERAATPAKVYKLARKYMKKRKYLIQQSVTLSYEDRPVDFRVILQKDESQKWSCSGLVAKLGDKDRICTNGPSSLCLAGEALQTIFGLTSEQALEKENEIIRISTRACRIMEQAYGIYADVGIDVVVDKNLNIWLIEINKIHQHTIAKYQHKDPDMFNRVITKPLAFAKALAGFK